MNLRKCLLTANSCYIANRKMADGKPTGIVVHSTAANNKTLRRYVQPLKTDEDYEAIIDDLGRNIYKNHWNRSKEEMKRSVCVHAFIGTNAKGLIRTYQTLPFDVCCWGCGRAEKGSYNYDPTPRVQFEICEDGGRDEKYFRKVMDEATDFCAYLCRTFSLKPESISSHRESHLAGYANNHGDPEHWMKNFGYDMNDFRDEVKRKLSPSPNARPIDYTVREWQLEAIEDGFELPKYGADGLWGDECRTVAKKATVRRRTPFYLYRNLTRFVQKRVGVTVDGKCGKDTERAIKRYQAANGLKADGICGINTWESLLKIND